MGVDVRGRGNSRKKKDTTLGRGATTTVESMDRGRAEGEITKKLEEYEDGPPRGGDGLQSMNTKRKKVKQLRRERCGGESGESGNGEGKSEGTKGPQGEGNMDGEVRLK